MFDCIYMCVLMFDVLIKYQSKEWFSNSNTMNPIPLTLKKYTSTQMIKDVASISHLITGTA